MASFASIKRAIKPGTRVTLTHHGNAGPGQRIGWGSGTQTLPFTREVVKVQSNAIAFAPLTEGDPESWLYWPRATDVVVEDEHTFAVHAALPMRYVIESN